jgi:hypothetical protein
MNFKACKGVSYRWIFAFAALAFTFNGLVLGQDKCTKWTSPWFTTPSYFNSPQITCQTIGDLANQKTPESQSTYTPRKIDDDLWMCDRDGNPYTQINRATRDDHCENFVFGPYSMLSDAWVADFRIPKRPGFGYRIVQIPFGFRFRGWAFDGTQRDAILEVNNPISGDYTSDLMEHEDLRQFEAPECKGQLRKNHPNPDCRPEIHHIVPRIDSKGCACGANSYKNALVISHKLNNAMSNNANHPALQAILTKFSIAPTAIEGNIITGKEGMNFRAPRKVRMPTKARPRK